MDRKAAKISALSSSELEKYEYLTGDDVGYKRDVIQKAKFEYSPLDKVFNIGPDESDKQERLLKRLINIQGKNDQQLEAIKDQGKQLRVPTKKIDETYDFESLSFRNNLLNSEAKKVLNDINEKSKKINFTKLVCIGSGRHRYNFTIFLDLKTFAESIYDDNLSLEAAKIKQRNTENIIEKLDEYNPKIKEYKIKRKILYIMKENKGKKMNLIAFENYALPLSKQYPSGSYGWKEHEMDSLHILHGESGELLPSVKHIKEKTEQERVLKKVLKGKYDTIDELYKLLFKAKRHADSDLIKEHINYDDLVEMQERLDNTKGTYKNRSK